MESKKCQSKNFDVPCTREAKYYVLRESITPHYTCEECGRRWKRIGATLIPMENINEIG